ncbi:MAG: zinc ribbon domain-containing protein [Gemmatimonadales bacterium]|jgi:hypothetical protein
MALIDCPECGIEISDRAQFCPRCGLPLARARPGGRHERGTLNVPVVPMTGLDVVKSIVGRLALGVVFFASGAVWESPPVILGSLVLAGSSLPLYLKARHAERSAVRGVGVGDVARVEERVERRLLEAEDRTARQLAEIDRATLRVTELEERLEFMERLLAREREEREGERGRVLPPGRTP